MGNAEEEDVTDELKLDLKACPFCGCEASVTTVGDVVIEHTRLLNGFVDTFFYVECTNYRCGARTKSWHPLKAAVSAWEKREA